VQTTLFQAPGLYADHHVTAVRQALLSLPGVGEVYASSAFFVVEVTYDEAVISPDSLKNKLDELGYSSEIPIRTESWSLSETGGSFRQSATYEVLKKTMSFQQRVPADSRPLWYCPGLGPIAPTEN
jgi:copper chaperone CopZ